MKNLGVFFLLFIVLVSLLPCSDEAKSHDITAATNFEITHGDDEAQENCSSICMCACCGQRIVAVKQMQFRIEAPNQFPNHTSKNYHFFLEQLDSNIWQPPKIS